MNVFLSKKAILPVLTGALLATGGCTSSFNPATDPDSVLAPRIQQLVDSHNRFPRWADFPVASTDTPTAAYVASQVEGLGQDSQTLAQQVAEIDWTLNSDPSNFEAMVRQKFDLEQMKAIGPQSPQAVEALADELRRKATPPPPIDRPRF